MMKKTFRVSRSDLKNKSFKAPQQSQGQKLPRTANLAPLKPLVITVLQQRHKP